MGTDEGLRRQSAQVTRHSVEMTRDFARTVDGLCSSYAPAAAGLVSDELLSEFEDAIEGVVASYERLREAVRSSRQSPRPEG